MLARPSKRARRSVRSPLRSLPDEVRVALCTWLACDDLGRLECTAASMVPTVGAAVQKQSAGAFGRPAPARLPRESWGMLARFTSWRFFGGPAGIALGAAHCAYIRHSGSGLGDGSSGPSCCFTLGNGAAGQLGNCKKNKRAAPAPVVLPPPPQEGGAGGGAGGGASAAAAAATVDPPTAVACGDDFTAVLTAGGRLYTFGRSFDGRLGLGSNAAGGVTAGSSSSSSSSSGSGSVQRPALVRGALGGIRVASVSCAGGSTAAVTGCGALFTWGLGRRHQLGHGGVRSEPSPRRVRAFLAHRVVRACMGATCAAAVTAGGALYTWGTNSGSNLGQQTRGDVTQPAQADTLGFAVADAAICRTHAAVVTTTGELIAFGLGQRRPAVVTALQGARVVAVAVTAVVGVRACSHTVALTSAGRVYVFAGRRSGGMFADEQALAALCDRRIAAIAAVPSSPTWAALSRSGAVATLGESAQYAAFEHIDVAAEPDPEADD
jgi:alpha-tubulin suppressor-like RCC1 family protein